MVGVAPLHRARRGHVSTTRVAAVDCGTNSIRLLVADIDDDELVPLVQNLGGHDLGVLLDDTDLYPEEILSEVARALGFGELFDDLVGLKR